MSKLKIITIPDECLRQKSQPVKKFDAELEKLVADLKNTLESQAEPFGLGLSAPQIGVLKRVFVARIGIKAKQKSTKNKRSQENSENLGKILAFINPKILNFSEKKILLLEGCFSVPQYYGHVIRPAEIDLEAVDEKGKRLKKHYRGISARVIQHEIDHLNGVLFIDHIHTQNGKLYKVVKDKKGKEKFQEVALG